MNHLFACVKRPRLIQYCRLDGPPSTRSDVLNSSENLKLGGSMPPEQTLLLISMRTAWLNIGREFATGMQAMLCEAAGG